MAKIYLKMYNPKSSFSNGEEASADIDRLITEEFGEEMLDEFDNALEELSTNHALKYQILLFWDLADKMRITEWSGPKESLLAFKDDFASNEVIQQVVNFLKTKHWIINLHPTINEHD